MPNRAALILRLGLAFGFLYVAVASLSNPLAWIGFFPQFLRDLVSSKILLGAFSGYEAILGLWLLLGKGLLYSALFSALTLAGIVLFNWGAMDIVFRDVGLALAAVALAVLARESNS